MLISFTANSAMIFALHMNIIYRQSLIIVSINVPLMIDCKYLLLCSTSISMYIYIYIE